MIPDRKDYLKQQAQNGQKIMGVLPALYPREVLWALEILPAEIWDPPGDILHANAHLQTTICPVVKQSLEFILTQPDTINSGYLFPHTCDSLQNLATQVKDLIGVPQPVYTFYNPKGEFNRTTRTYYTDILRNFQDTLEEIHGPVSPEKLREACELGHKIDTLRIELQIARMSDRVDLSNAEYLNILRAGEYLLAHDYLDVLNSVDILELPIESNDSRILLSGILPPHPNVLSYFDELNIMIVAEDLLAGSRRVPKFAMDAPGDPLEYLTDRFFLLPPCSTRAGSLHERLHYLKQLIIDSKAQGLLFNIVKFCEPELFDHRLLVKKIKESEIPVLSIDTELKSGLSGQDKTRIEAFAELLMDRESL